jgi:hypothetical protein
MKARYGERFVRISITITDPEPIFHWERTRRSHERFSHPKGDPSYRYRSSEDCTTATNDGLPEKGQKPAGPLCLFLAFELSCPNNAGALLCLGELVHQIQAEPQTARPFADYFAE